MSSQPPTQAGKFKPKKPKKKAAVKQPAAAKISTPGAAGASAIAVAAGERGNDGPPSGRGGGRGGRSSGRGGRSSGRGGRGRGGRFVQPKGQVFFTASSTSALNTNNNRKKGPLASTLQEEINSNDDVIIMPGMSGSTSSKKSGPSLVATTAKGRLAAAAQARKGEGDEVIVGSIGDGEGIGDNRKVKGSILDRMTSGNDHRPSLFDDQENTDNIAANAADFTYDSDSSNDGEPERIRQKINASTRQKKGGKKIRPQYTPLLPHQLPLPPTKRPGLEKIDFMYECQTEKKEMESSTTSNGEKECKVDNSRRAEEILYDPPLEPPFLNLKISSQEQQMEEQKSWILFKFPTRLPRLEPQSTISGLTVKEEEAMDVDDDDDDKLQEPSQLLDPSEPLPETVTSLNNANNDEDQPKIGESTSTATPDATSSTGFDDTLKDSAPGRYGKIVVYKSGRAYLVVGDKNDSKTPPVRMRLENGLPCGFLQQAVSIDTNNGYVPLGEVKKSIIVMPDVERAFPSA